MGAKFNTPRGPKYDLEMESIMIDLEILGKRVAEQETPDPIMESHMMYDIEEEYTRQLVKKLKVLKAAVNDVLKLMGELEK